MRHASFWPVMALAVLSLIWGYNWVVMKYALQDCPPLLFAALRVIGGTVVLFVMLKLMNRPLSPPPFSYVFPLGLLQSTGFVGCTLWALEFGKAGKTAILVYMMPLWLILLATIFLKEQIHGLQRPALLFAAIGLLFILEPWHLHGGRGILLAIASGLFWAASAIWQKMKSPPGVDLLDATAWQMLFGGVVLLLLSLVVDPLKIDWTFRFAWALFYNAIPGNAIAWLLWSYALHRLPSGVAGMGTLLAPAVGIIAAWIQLGERPGFFEALGMAMIFLAMILVSGEHWRQRSRILPMER